MSNFQNSRNSRLLLERDSVMSEKEDSTSKVEKYKEDHLGNTQLGLFYKAGSILRTTQACLRTWVMADFAALFKKEANEERNDLQGELNNWYVLDSALSVMIRASLSSDSLEDYKPKFMEAIDKELSGLDLKWLSGMRDNLKWWFIAYSAQVDDCLDNHSSYDHAVSFIYMDELVCALIAIEEDSEKADTPS